MLRILSSGLLLLAVGVTIQDRPGLERAGDLRPAGLNEASGIVASPRHPGVFWLHDDSGNPARIFAVAADGRLLRVCGVAALNLDWEDIASDGAGRLVIADIGNNAGALPLRALYLVAEPDPAGQAAGPIAPEHAVRFVYPGGERPDAEALFVDGDRAVVIAKERDGGEARLFTVPLAPAILPVQAEPAGRLPGFHEPVTGADLHADGRRLVVASYGVARVYSRADGGWRLTGSRRFRADGVEAVCWDGDDVLLASEAGSLYRLRPADWSQERDAP